MNRPIRIGIVAGEPSGDVLAAGLIRNIKARYPDAIIEGIGGQNMIDAGCNSLFDIETLSVMGLVEVLSSIRPILKLKKALVSHFKSTPPDVYIGVDAPDFNLRVEKELKASGIKTVHYVSPTVWAWREKRIHKIAAATDLVLGLFPFEKQVYDAYKVAYQFVGHTMADSIPLKPDQSVARKQLNIDEQAFCLAVLPGSRKGELKTLLPTFISTIDRVMNELPDSQFVIPAANDARFNQIVDHIKEFAPQLLVNNRCKIVKQNTRTAMIASNVVLLASGTATLEAMLCKRPMVVAYKMSKITFRMMKRMYKPSFFALPNILANAQLVPEFLQEDVNPINLANNILQLSKEDNSELICRFTEIHKTLKLGADKQAADAILSLVHG